MWNLTMSFDQRRVVTLASLRVEFFLNSDYVGNSPEMKLAFMAALLSMEMTRIFALFHKLARCFQV